MKQAVLMPTEEPTDRQLEELMKEVAMDVKQKVLATKKLLAEKIMMEIQIAQERFDSTSV